MALPLQLSWLRMPGRLATPTSNWLRMRRGDGTQESQAAEEPRQLSLPRSIHPHCPRTHYSSIPCLGDRPTPLKATATTWCYYQPAATIPKTADKVVLVKLVPVSGLADSCSIGRHGISWAGLCKGRLRHLGGLWNLQLARENKSKIPWYGVVATEIA
ncbi:hypothetical protein TsFJ059_002753 [Trichoderma semiorbis]|uniref:Uncharacterized protein n=1 Tax=Trichoderma semiorbis TaxID=1491008 RepID=A0A9P8HQ19_9HYPO|nr:hypothetical protein TsFJ059_002753 [Trichoderma semiorbis]